MRKLRTCGSERSPGVISVIYIMASSAEWIYSKKTDWILRACGMIYIVGFGHYWYLTESPPPRPIDFAWGMILSLPFSLGIFTSTLDFGKRFRRTSQTILIVSLGVHALFPIELRALLIVDLFAILKLHFGRIRTHDV